MKKFFEKFLGCCAKTPNETYTNQVDEEFDNRQITQSTATISHCSSEEPDPITSTHSSKRSKSSESITENNNVSDIKKTSESHNIDAKLTTSTLSSSSEDVKYVTVKSRCTSPIREIIIDSYTQSK